MNDPIAEAVEHAAEFGGGPERIWQVPETAAVNLGEGRGHPFDGMTIAQWRD